MKIKLDNDKKYVLAYREMGEINLETDSSGDLHEMSADEILISYNKWLQQKTIEGLFIVTTTVSQVDTELWLAYTRCGGEVFLILNAQQPQVFTQDQAQTRINEFNRNGYRCWRLVPLEIKR